MIQCAAQALSLLTRLLHDVGNPTGAVLAVLKGDFGLAWPLHSNTEPSGPSLPRPDAELRYTHAKTELAIQCKITHWILHSQPRHHTNLVLQPPLSPGLALQHALCERHPHPGGRQ